MKTLSELSKHTLSKYFVKSVKDHDKLLDKKKKLGGKSTPEISARMNKRAAGLDRALPRLQHEDVEPIEELNKDTLYSYKKKAEKDETDKFRASAKAMKDNDSVTANKSSHQAIKRMQGIEKADARLAKEEVETIDEISKDLAGKYIDAVHKKNMEAGHAAAKPGWKPTDTKTFARNLSNRAKGLRRATDIKYAKEEVEMTQPLDEISRKTLGSYVAHASNDAVNKTVDAAKSLKDKKIRDWHTTTKKVDKRLTGIDKAAARLKKEDVEPLEELSKDTVKSYMDKSRANYAVHHRDGIVYWKIGNKKKEGQALAKMKVRGAGMDRAQDRLNKEETEMTEKLTEAKRLISRHGNEGDVHTAKVYKDTDWDEYQVHHFKHGKHMGEGPVSHHDDKKDAQQTADFEVKRQNARHAAENMHKEEIEMQESVHLDKYTSGKLNLKIHPSHIYKSIQEFGTHKTAKAVQNLHDNGHIETHEAKHHLNYINSHIPGDGSGNKDRYHFAGTKHYKIDDPRLKSESVGEEEQINELSSDTLTNYMKKKRRVIDKQTRFGGKAKEKDVDNYRKAWSKRDDAEDQGRISSRLHREEVEVEDEVIDELQNNIDSSIEATIEHAFEGDAAEMRDELYAAIQGKIAQALEIKKQELANSLVAGSITKEEVEEVEEAKTPSWEKEGSWSKQMKKQEKKYAPAPKTPSSPSKKD